MKTIDINLIGSLETASGKNKAKKKSAEIIDPKTKVISITMVIGSCIVFLLCDGIWFFSIHSTKKAQAEIKNLKAQQEDLKEKITQSSNDLKSLKNQKKILELKLLAQNQIQSSILPWEEIMSEIAASVPSIIKITEIVKEDRANDLKLTISGQINSDKNDKTSPLEAISFFTLNLSANPDKSTLKNAVIKKINYIKQSDVYDFSIETSINPPINLAEQNDQKKAG